MSRFNRETSWANIKDQYMLSPILGGDGRILIKEDPYKDRFECTTCHGKGHTEEICKWCNGTKWEKGDEENGYCRDCTVGEAGLGKTLGFVPCKSCNGQGGSIIVPDENKRNTTMGDVLAVSEDGINILKPGDKVLFTNYTGSPFKFIETDLRVCCEKDILCIAKLLKPNVDGLTEGTYAELDNIGVPHE